MLRKLKLKNFRLLSDFELNDISNLLIIEGPNASGKTSILEAIYLLSTTKSPRTNELESLIQNDKEFLIAECEYNESKYKMILSKNGKAAYINGIEYKKFSDYIAGVLMVMFSPKDLNLVIGSKTERRRFFDLMISLCDKKYIWTLNQYKSVLKERNEILKQFTADKQLILDVVTDKLAELGENIYKRRKNFISLLNKHINETTKFMEFENIEVEYIPSVEGDFKLNFKQKEKNDIFLKTTNQGIHRDDYGFKINGQKAAVYGSQGQIRTVVVCLKLALKEVCELCNKRNVILLLDDVFAELDKERQKNLVLYLLKQKQAIITTTSIKEIPSEITNMASILRIEKGSIKLWKTKK